MSVNDSIVTSPSLLARVRQNEPQSWRRLVNLYSPLVYRWCRGWGVPADDVADVMQEIFQRVAKGVEQFAVDGRQASFRRWLWTIARHAAVDWNARRARSPQVIGGTDQQMLLLTIPENYSDADDDLVADDSQRLVHQAVNAVRGDFQERTWQIFWTIVAEGRTAAEVAADLGMTGRAVRQAKHRVLKRLREEYQDLVDSLQPPGEFV